MSTARWNATAAPRDTIEFADCALHKAIARVVEDPPFDGFDWNYVSPDGLSVRDAWEFAMAWCDHVRDHLTVRTDDVDEAYGTIPNYEWIQFRLGCCGPVSVAAARASSIVWRALAACRGFSGDEHPAFWKRILDEHQQEHNPKGHPPRYGEKKTTTDANLFFQGGVVFPRFWLQENDDAFETPNTARLGQIIQIYCGLRTDTECDAVYTRMDEIVERLRPFVTANLAPIELSLGFLSDLNSEPEVNALLSSIQADTRNTVDAMRSPSFTLVDVHLQMPYANMKDRHPWETMCGATIQAARIALQTISTDARKLSYKSFVRRALGTTVNGEIHGLVGGIRHIQCQRRFVHDPLSMICSALPYARTLETFEISGEDRSLNELDLAWIGYALFHPDADTSSWRRLLFRGLYLYRTQSNVAVAQIWEIMAQGNNLAFMMRETETRVDGYFQATIQADSVIRADPRDDCHVVEDVVNVSLYDVCVETTDVKKLKDWVRVIVVGYGDAWVRSSSVVQIVNRPPGCSRLSTLGFHECRLESEFGLAQFLQFVGEQLKVLLLDGLYFRGLDLARLTPHLESLRVKTNEMFFRDLTLPRSVRTLYLVDRSSSTTILRDALHDLPNLTALCLRKFKHMTAPAMSALLAPILKNSPQLRYLCWKAGKETDPSFEFKREGAVLTYPLLRSLSHCLIRQLEAESGDASVFKAPRETLVALISVVKLSDEDSALAQVDAEMVRMIGGFVGSPLPQLLQVVGYHTCWLTRKQPWSPEPYM